MRSYEIVVITDAALDDDAVSASLERIRTGITAHGGTVNRVDRWGKRRFAYELDHRWEGHYALLEATLEPASIVEIERGLTLADEVLRFKTIRLPDKVVAARNSRRSGEPAAAGAQSTGA